MEKQLHTWSFIAAALAKGEPVMLLYVVESTGSSPGRAGFFMAVSGTGNLHGSIGGGIMEHKWVQLAREKLEQGGPELLVRRQIHDKSAPQHQSGMICSGEQTLVMYRLQPADLSVVRQIILRLQQRKEAVLQLSPSGIALRERVIQEIYTFEKVSDNQWLYQEKLGHQPQLHIIGAGHCGLALSRAMRMLDFRITLYDDRSALNTFEQNHFAHEKRLLSNYGELATMIGEEDYVVVMTAGYRTDDLVLRTLMHKRFRFIGVLGSRKKLEQLFDAYRREGVEEAVLRRIHAPVGLPVNSQTPEEIAVSIAAQIIAIKNTAVHEPI